MILMVCVHAVCIEFIHCHHPQTLPWSLTGVFFLLLNPLPCLLLAPGDDTLLEFTSCAGGAVRGEERESDYVVQISLCSASTNQDHLVSPFLHSFLYPSCTLCYSFIFFPIYAVFLSGLWLFNVICLESSLCIGGSTDFGVAVGAVNDLQCIHQSGGPRSETFWGAMYVSTLFYLMLRP